MERPLKRRIVGRVVSRTARVVACALLWILIGIDASKAQQPDPGEHAREAGDLIQTRRWFQGPGAGRDAPMLIETSPPIANLLTRAEDGIARRDWKLAIDSLQRVIDDRAGTLVPREDGATEGGVLFESARRLAVRRLASLPPEGLLSYRILFDGKAKGLFERAKIENDVVALRAVADRFLLTRYGDDAADLLASRALDEGRLAETVALLSDVQRFSPDNDIPPDRICAKLAAAYKLMGFASRAAEVVDEYRRELGAKEQLLEWLDELVSTDANDPWASRAHGQILAARAGGASGLLSGVLGPPLNPSLMEHVPWSFDLEGAVADLWRRIAGDDPTAPPPIPRIDLVGDSARLFVRVPGGCASLRADDLSGVWRAETQSAARSLSPRMFTRRGRSGFTVAAPVGPYTDDPSNTISTARGLVFTLENSGTGEFLDQDEVGGQRLLFIRQPVRVFRTMSNGNRLVALDATTGAIRWQRGRTDSSVDLLGDVRFLSTPIGVGDSVWAPFLQGSDLFVGVLRPSDGAVLQIILLGSVRESPEGSGPTTPPVMVDGIVYIPTGFGVLYAVDAERMALRWAAVYDTQMSTNRRLPTIAPRFWLPAPPTVSGGVVLLAPTDFGEVMAFDSATGEYRWSDDADGCSYLIAADRGRVWLGGRKIICRQLSDGKVLWTTHLLGVPTGKSVACGDEIHVPTSGGLITLDALSGGIKGEQQIPASQPPLGNLVCMNTGLYSVDASSIRKFPDIDRMHAAASATLAKNPKDSSAAVQLAWAELLSERPQLALDAISPFPTVESVENSNAEAAIARVRVEALLSLASQAKSPDEALRLARQADRAAVSGESRLRCRSAIADRLVALGRNLDAYRELLEVGLCSDADALLEIEDGLTAVARVEIGKRLRQLNIQMTADERRSLAVESDQRIETLTRQLRAGSDRNAARDELSALIDLGFHSPMGQRAAYELAEWEIEQQLFERAEQRLRQSARFDDPIWSAAARVRLCDMYAESDDSSIGLLLPCLDELESQFGNSTIPEVCRGRLSNPPSSARISDWTAQVRSRFSKDSPEAALAAMRGETSRPSPAFSLSGRYAWTYEPPEEAEPARMVLFGATPPPAMMDRIVIMGREGFLECVSTDRRELLWRTQLRLPGVFSDMPIDPRVLLSNTARTGVVDGQTAVFNGPEGIFAVGLRTGRRLWARVFDQPLLDAAAATVRDSMMSANRGALAAMPRDGRLTLMRLTDGETIWERDLHGEYVAQVSLNESSVVLIDQASKRVHLLDRDTGRFIKRVNFSQPDPEHERIGLVQAGGMIYGPDSDEHGDGIAGYDLSDGERRWRIGLDKPVVALFEPKANYLGIGQLNGDLRIVNATTGETILERSDPNIRAVIGGIMWEGTLILRCEGLRGPRQGTELAAIDIATGAEVWRRRDATTLITTDAPLSIIGGVIPAIIEQRRPDANPQHVAAPRAGAALTLIDVRTGGDSGTPVDLNLSVQGATLNGDMWFWPNVIAVGTVKGIHALRVEVSVANQGKDF